MSKIAFTAVLPLVFLSAGLGQNCALSGTPAWSKEVKDIIADCDNRLTSPDRTLVLNIGIEGQIEISKPGSKEKTKAQARAVQPPAMASWSPKSSAFFVNDGEGSGMSSVFRLFRIQSDHIVEDSTPQAQAVMLYRRLKECGSKGNDPEVWGLGWSSDGTRLYLFIQATVHDPCGESASFIVATVILADDSLVEHFTEAAAKRKFRALLPHEVF